MAREYPPHVYGGAGVHLEYLAAEMAKLARVDVLCFGAREPQAGNPAVRGFEAGDARLDASPHPARDALRALAVCQRFVAEPLRVDVVHCHTWYAHWGGVLAKLAYGLPLVVTVHSLEPLRPWKREQLGGGYDVSSWIERTALGCADAVVAVSESTRREVLEHFDLPAARVRVIPNGIDAAIYRRTAGGATLRRLGVDADRPYVLFLGRLSRQKGVLHFQRAAAQLPRGVQVVLCATHADAPAIEAEVEAELGALRRGRDSVHWIREMLPRAEAVVLYSAAALFCCPSIYEPFGMINLEAMACGTPVVASAVGGIPEVVDDGTSGLLVAFEPAAGGAPARPADFERDLAAAMRRLLEAPSLRERMGHAARERVERHFGWAGVAARTLELYREVANSREVKVDGA